MANAPSTLPPTLNCLCLLPPLAEKGCPRADARCPRHSSSTASWQKPAADSAGARQPVSQNDGKKGEVYGYDGGKQVKGRKRHLIVDTLGLVFKVIVSEGNAAERVVGLYGLWELKEEAEGVVSQLKQVWVDRGYQGARFRESVKPVMGATVVVMGGGGKGFELVRRRWVVERTYGWLNGWRRLSKEYEGLGEMSEAMVHGVMCRLMLSRLAPSH